jgi:hypothetical protein
MKVRQNLYIDRALSDALEALAAKPGTNKSRLVNDALAAWLASRATAQVDTLLKLRLDRMSRELGRIARDVEVLLESLSLFVRYQLAVTAPLPEADSAARAIGRDRFEAFVAQVGRQIAAGTRTLGEPDDTGPIS